MKSTIQMPIKNIKSDGNKICSEEWSSELSLIIQSCVHCMQQPNNSDISVLQTKIKDYLSINKEGNHAQTQSGRIRLIFRQLQWKNNQKSTSLAFLRETFNSMIKQQQKDSKQTGKQGLPINSKQQTCCICNKCMIIGGIQSGKTSIKSEKTCFLSLQEIQQSPTNIPKKDQQYNKLNLIFDLIREERKQLWKAQQLKKEKKETILSIYSDLMGLDKDKYCKESFSEDEIEKKKEKLYHQLSNKNALNSKQIRRFIRRVFLKNNQNEIIKQSSFQSNKTVKQITSPEQGKFSQNKMMPINTSNTSRLKNIDLKLTRKDQILQQIPIIRQNIQKFSVLKAKVDSNLERLEIREQKRTNILKNIVFNAGDLFLMDRRHLSKARVERPYFSRFDKMMKSSRQMVKMGGVRRSLDQLVSAVAIA